MEYHELANMFPMVDANIKAIAASIKEGGYNKETPIVLYQGKILDGRHRWEACKLTNTQPEIIYYTGNDPLKYVIDKNLNRYHLNESQRAVVAAKLANMKHGDNRFTIDRAENLPVYNSETIPQVSQAQAAEMLNVSDRSIRTIKDIERKAPELIEKIERGEMTAGEANKLVRKADQLQNTKNEIDLAIHKPIIKNCGFQDLLAQIDSIDLLLTDPPYSSHIENIDEFAKSWVPQALSKIKKDGRAYIFIGAYSVEIISYLSIIENLNWHTEILPWVYNNTLGPNPKNNYFRNWQVCIHAWRDTSRELDCDILTEKCAAKTINAPQGSNQVRYHAWQKPEELIEQYIKHASKPNDLIVDLFSGTGTTLVSASKLGRRAIGSEIDKDMIDLCVRRGCELG